LPSKRLRDQTCRVIHKFTGCGKRNIQNIEALRKLALHPNSYWQRRPIQLATGLVQAAEAQQTVTIRRW
jgi:hypothetical protein